MRTQHGSGRRTRVVVIGSGLGSLFAARALRRADVDLTLIAKTGHHLFQPLLYQVATGNLSEGEVAAPTRGSCVGRRTRAWSWARSPTSTSTPGWSSRPSSGGPMCISTTT